MKNIKKIKKSSISKLVKKNLSDEFLVSENRIDDIIKEYLFERSGFLYDQNQNDVLEFTTKTIKNLSNISDNLLDIISSLQIIKDKEGDVLVYTDVYSDEIISNIINYLIDVRDDIDFLTQLKNDETDLI